METANRLSVSNQKSYGFVKAGSAPEAIRGSARYATSTKSGSKSGLRFLTTFSVICINPLIYNW